MVSERRWREWGLAMYGAPEIVELIDSRGRRYVQLRFSIYAARRFFVDPDGDLIVDTCRRVKEILETGATNKQVAAE